MIAKSNIKIILLALSFFITIMGCDNFIDSKGKPYVRTQQDSLSFLVSNSDLIAIVFLSGGTDKPRPSMFTMPKNVNAKILSIIKGGETKGSIEISSNPKNLGPGVIKSTVVLRNGKHLVFLSKDGDSYKPTTGNSLLNIFNNRVHPIWRPEQYEEYNDAPEGMKISKGIELKEIIEEIRIETTKANQKIKRTS